MRALKYSLEEGFDSLWRGRRSAILSIGTITAAVFVLGGLLVVTSSLNGALARWSAAAELSVYLRTDLSPDQRAAIDRTLADSDLVVDREDLSAADARRRFQRDFPDLAAAAVDTAPNPFPASIEVRVRPEAAGDSRLDGLAARLAGLAGVSDVRYDRQWIHRLLAAVALVRGVGLVLAAILTLAAGLTVATVVRLTLLGRRDEIEIMQLVGAPLAFIRGPFVVEGMLHGGLAAVAALALLWVGFTAVRARYGPMAAVLSDPLLIGFVSWRVLGGLLLGGMGVGCVGGLVAATSTRSR